MAAPLPKELRIPEISRFVNRAAQLRSIKPAIAYWCDYHAVNQIVSRRLHEADGPDGDCHAFTKALIERLEATKAERAGDDAITDNTAGQAVVEQFAQQTFDRAERTLRAGKVTRQTADTFDAAATFFELTNVWAPPDAEMHQKVKFAKWNAARILKAIREGRDPNETNPKLPDPQPEAETEAGGALDPADPDVQEITGAGPAPAQPASVEEVPDDDTTDTRPADLQSPSAQLSPPPPPVQEDYFPSPSQQQQPFSATAAAPDPFAPSPLSDSPAVPGPGVAPVVPPATEPQFSPAPTPQAPTSFPPPISPSAPPPGPNQPAPPPWMTTPGAPHPLGPNPPPPIPQPSVPAYTPPPPAPVVPSASSPAVPVSDHKDIERAQKHAKFAISALNFDDVATAVQELRTALAMLGVQ